MKHIKLFEAFESEKLTKTLGFIDKPSKARFINDLKQICDKIDYPYSKLSDDNFQYLPFKSALKINRINTDIPCGVTSKDIFGSAGIEGEVCTNGKLTRTWGKGIRHTVCPACNGTGVKQTSPEIKWIKFWFSSDGKYLSTTAVDGVIRNDINIGAIKIGEDGYFKTGRTMGYNELEHGDYVAADLSGTKAFGRIWVDQNDNKYIIQNQREGGVANNYRREWSNIGKYSWSLAGGEFRGEFYEIKPKPNSEDGLETEPDPMTWNVPLSIGRGFSIDARSSVSEKIKDAHFAIVMDFGKIKESEFKKKHNIKSDRVDSRIGASKFFKDEDIKQQNIKKYIDLLAKKLDLSKGIEEITKTLPRLFGSRLSVHYVWGGKNMYEFNEIIDYVFKFIQTTDDEQKVLLSARISSLLKSIYRKNNEYNTDLNEQIKETIKVIENQDGEKYYMTFINKLNELSNKIDSSILRKPIESLNDLELAYNKLESLRRIMQSSRRSTAKLGRILDRSFSYSNLQRFNENEVKSIVGDIDTIMEMIDKL